ncbi:MAG: hypothetical protein ACM31O_03795 [Bacteroidota bacterium]
MSFPAKPWIVIALALVAGFIGNWAWKAHLDARVVAYKVLLVQEGQLAARTLHDELSRQEAERKKLLVGAWQRALPARPSLSVTE